MSLKTKSRERNQKVEFASASNNTGVVSKGATLVYKGSQYTETEGHERGRDGRYHSGGPFYTVRREVAPGLAHYSGSRKIVDPKSSLKLVGNVATPVPKMPSSFYPSTAHSMSSVDSDSLEEDGTTAIAQTAPINAASKVAVLLGEVRKDGIPSIPGILSWKKRTEIAKSAGSEYLNYQFGWRPLVEEVLQVGHAARHSRDIVQQYHRDEGKLVHRTFEFPIEKSYLEVTETFAGAICSFEGNDFTSSFRGNQTATRTLVSAAESRKWFSGAYTYALPSRTDSFRKMLGYGSEADKLFGITLSPDVLWELSPWSWAVDWFTNAGDVIHNATNFGLAGLVLGYGYMMRETTHSYTYNLSNMNLIGSEGRPMPPSSDFRREKVRIPAGPFGFGFTGVDLSPTQVAITVALGLTKL